MLDIVLLSIAAMSAIIAAITGYRNNKVYRLRRSLLDQASAQAQVDIAYGLPWVWRYEALENVSYFRMVWSFWRPVGSFYPDKAFIQPHEKLTS